MRLRALSVAALIALGFVSTVRAGDPPPQPPKPPLQGGATPRPAASDFRIARISTACYAAISTNGGSNAGFVVGRDKVLVIDALGAPVRAERLIREIAAITSKPIAALVLTHWHYDHAVGNQAFPEKTPIYADPRSHVKLEDRLKGDALLLSPGSGYHGTVGIGKVRVPDHDVTGQIEIDLGGLVVTVASPEARNGGHSVGDLVAWVGSEKVLYAGDLVSNGYVPNIADGETFPWIVTLARLSKLPAERVVPGHGEPGGPEILMVQREYLSALRRLVKHLAKSGVSELEAASKYPLPDEWQGLGFREWWPDNVRYVYKELVAGK